MRGYEHIFIPVLDRFHSTFTLISYFCLLSCAKVGAQSNLTECPFQAHIASQHALRRHRTLLGLIGNICL